MFGMNMRMNLIKNKKNIFLSHMEYQDQRPNIQCVSKYMGTPNMNKMRTKHSNEESCAKILNQLQDKDIKL